MIRGAVELSHEVMQGTRCRGQARRGVMAGIPIGQHSPVRAVLHAGHKLPPLDDSIREETLTLLDELEQTLAAAINETLEHQHARRAKLAYLLVSARSVRKNLEPLLDYLGGAGSGGE